MSLLDTNNADKKTFNLLAIVVVLVGLSVIFSLLYPGAFSLVVSILWVVLLGIVIVFFALGLLVVIGLKKEASRLLEVLFEGSLTIIDLIEFIRLSIRKFVSLLRDFLLFIAPFLAFISALFIYVLFILVYKLVGRTYDVTLLTIVLTFIFVSAIGILNSSDRNLTKVDWAAKFTKKFHNYFSDFLEVVLFVFFLTMDSTHLFFLPQNLNIEIRAQVGTYDLMKRSFMVNDHLKITLNIIIAGILTEIIRNIIRLLVLSIKEYKARRLQSTERSAVVFKESIRFSFNQSKDDILKFITFTTILISGFLVFPRLKLLTIAVGSLTSLILDLMFSKRLSSVKGGDLISRIIVKVFKL